MQVTVVVEATANWLPEAGLQVRVWMPEGESTLGAKVGATYNWPAGAATFRDAGQVMLDGEV